MTRDLAYTKVPDNTWKCTLPVCFLATYLLSDSSTHQFSEVTLLTIWGWRVMRMMPVSHICSLGSSMAATCVYEVV